MNARNYIVGTVGEKSFVPESHVGSIYIVCHKNNFIYKGTWTQKVLIQVVLYSSMYYRHTYKFDRLYNVHVSVFYVN